MKKILTLLMLCLFINISDCISQEQNRRDYSVTCQGTTKKGKSCKNPTRCNNSLCHWHGGNCYDQSKKKLPIKTLGNMKYILGVHGEIEQVVKIGISAQISR